MDESDKCPKCGHERRFHFAVNDGEETDAWCEVDGCHGCDEIFGGVPGRPGTIDGLIAEGKELEKQLPLCPCGARMRWLAAAPGVECLICERRWLFMFSSGNLIELPRNT